ncbi:MAG: protein kinase [Magnetococcales bacterium]|nr:protein kinase [Magnetococcales bacterium]
MQEMTLDSAQEILAEALPTYHIEKKIGEGTYGAVFLAYDNGTECHYAVKFFRMEVQRAIKGGKLADATSRLNRDWRLLMEHHERFKTCSALVDIPIFFKVDTQEVVHGQAAAWGIAVMEYFPSNLHDFILDYMEKHGKPLPPGRRLILLQELAKTLIFLHSITDSDGHLFVYEDLKPENVLVADISGVDTPRVVIGDIGGLKRIGGSSLSSGGQITQRYAAPEILRQGQRVDQQAVVYSFGLIGYFVIEGNIPYDTVSLDERFDLIDAKLDFTPEMFEGLESAGEVIRKCLSSDRQKRYANFEEVSQALSQTEERAGSGPTILPAIHHDEPAPTPVSVDIKPLSNDKNIVTGSGETVVPARPPDEEKVKNIQEEKYNDGQNIISQPSSSYISKNKNLLAAAVFGILLVSGIIIFVKDKDNQRTVDASSNALQTVPPSPNVAHTDKKSSTNGNKVSASLEDENERRKTEETKRETERLTQEAAMIKRDVLEAKRIEAELELARLQEEERLRKEQEVKKREDEERAKIDAERLKRKQYDEETARIRKELEAAKKETERLNMLREAQEQDRIDAARREEERSIQLQEAQEQEKFETAQREAEWLKNVEIRRMKLGENTLKKIDISVEDGEKIGKNVWRNEGAGKDINLVAWNKDEEHASLGIGHFIWYPENNEGRFRESFPELIDFLIKNKINIPDWIASSKSCIWSSRQEMLADRKNKTEKYVQLLELMKTTIPYQVKFMIDRFNKALPEMLKSITDEKDRAKVISNFNSVAYQTDGGISFSGAYALLDYVNFKGEGTKQTERYRGEGWGLLQVLESMSDSTKNPIDEFVLSAKRILERRVRNAPDQSKEKGWLEGWFNRLDTYLIK